MNIWMMFNIFPFLSLILADDHNYCRTSSFSDPCLPGGKWDPVLKRCNGYDGGKCFQCFSGPQCKTVEGDNCVITGGGDPIVFQEYWESAEHGNGLPCTSVPSDFRPSYQLNRDDGINLPPLEKVVRQLHASVGNVDADGYEIVFGFGATQVTNAAMAALSAKLSSTTDKSRNGVVQIFAQVPYYSMYPVQANKTVYQAKDGNYYVSQWNVNANPDDKMTIEVSTWPNNPDSMMRPPKVKDDKRVIHDFTYLWPQFTSKYALHATHEIMIFSGSKLTGHAGSRFGWALVKDKALAMNMRHAMIPHSLGVSIDMEMRELGILSSIIAQGKGVPAGGYFDYNRQKMTSRWAKLVAIFSSPSAQKLGYKLTNNPLEGPFSFLKCPDGYHCPNLLMKQVNVFASSGVSRGTSDNYVRIGLLDRTVENKVLLTRLTKLVNMSLPSGPSNLFLTGPPVPLTTAEILEHHVP